MMKPAESNAAASKKPDEIVVFKVRTDTKCGECGRELLKGNLLRLENDKPLCLDCADLGHLEFLPSGDTALTRRATKHSPLRAVVVQWARARNRYERQGILVTAAAIEQAEAESLADADRRARQRERAALRREGEDQEYVAAFAEQLKILFPGCPAAEAESIAQHAAKKYSGRVGRSAAAKQFDPGALRLAVIAHIRHVHTRYDQLLNRFGDRARAREAVRDPIQAVLTRWEKPKTR
jgi:hypothetical protein